MLYPFHTETASNVGIDPLPKLKVKTSFATLVVNVGTLPAVLTFDTEVVVGEM